MTTPSIIDDAAFDRLLAPLGPFERRPKLAVAVSGGADSMALTLLAAQWAAARKGSVLALTVDHRLRKESAAEARQVGQWLAARTIAHDVLPWIGDKPSSGLQAAARAARYGLLLERCRDAGILHVLLAHHLDDQAETVLLRVAGGTGIDGLAAIASVSATTAVRLLRPFLTVPKATLEATLVAQGQSWVEDPSNTNAAFARVRLRRLMPSLGEAGVSPAALAEIAGQAGEVRTMLDDDAADLLARAVVLSPTGYARLDTNILRHARVAIGRRVLDRVLRTIGGGAHAPRRDRLDRLWAEILAGLTQRRSLGGCLVVPSRGTLLIHREPAAMEGPVTCRAGDTVHWDGRFTVRVNGRGTGQIGALGQKGWLAVKGEAGPQIFPAAVAMTLPALFDRPGSPVAVPHLGWQRGGDRGLSLVDLAFTPTSPLTGGLVWHRSGTMC